MAIRTTQHVTDAMSATRGPIPVPILIALTEQLSLLSLQVDLVCPVLQTEGKSIQDVLSEFKDYLSSRSFQLESTCDGRESTNCQVVKSSERVAGSKVTYRGNKTGRGRQNVRWHKHSSAPRQPRRPSFAKQTFSSASKLSPKKKGEHITPPSPPAPPIPHDLPVVRGGQSHASSPSSSVPGDEVLGASMADLPPHQLKYLRTEMMRCVTGYCIMICIYPSTPS